MKVFGKSISMTEIIYKDNKIVQFGESDFTAFVFADEDCEEIIEKNFTTLQDAKNWVDSKIS